MTEQATQLAEKPHVVIATPGRLADHIESGTNFSLSKIQMLVRKFSNFYMRVVLNVNFRWKTNFNDKNTRYLLTSFDRPGLLNIIFISKKKHYYMA